MPAGKPSIQINSGARDARRLSTLLEVSQALSGTLNLKAAMHRVLATLVRHHGVVRGMIVLQREGELRIEASEGFEDRARSVVYRLGEGVTGWAIGEDGRGDDAKDALSLYDKLERAILPLYYEDRPRWIGVMKGAISKNGPLFNSHRMMRRYATDAYLR